MASRKIGAARAGNPLQADKRGYLLRGFRCSLADSLGISKCFTDSFTREITLDSQVFNADEKGEFKKRRKAEAVLWKQQIRNWI
jgi:hypothetical protein